MVPGVTNVSASGPTALLNSCCGNTSVSLPRRETKGCPHQEASSRFVDQITESFAEALADFARNLTSVSDRNLPTDTDASEMPQRRASCSKSSGNTSQVAKLLATSTKELALPIRRLRALGNARKQGVARASTHFAT